MRNFNDWAKNIYVGGEGGNQSAPTWFCGIEPGGDIVDSTGIYKPSVNDLIALFEKYKVSGRDYCSWNDDFIKDNPSYSTWRFLQKVAKISLASLGRDIAMYKDFMKNEFLRINSDQFHINLYPLNFKRTDHALWDDRHTEISGMSSKSEYISWCRQNRFPQFRHILEGVTKKVIVCSGNSNESDFISAFIHSISDGPLLKDEFQIGPKKFATVYRFESQQLTLFITPFFGRGGLMADADFIALGQAIRNEHRRFS